MKKFFALTACALIAAALLLSSCKGAFVFVSVRMRGNGDGTITAVAQNEFSAGGNAPEVTLSLYYSETYRTDASKMELAASVTPCPLKFSEKTSITHSVKAEGYYLARILYLIDGEPRYIQSDAIRYGTDGKRK